MNNITKKILTILIMLLLILPAFSFAALDVDDAYNDGEDEGKDIGDTYGRRDYNNGDDNDWEDAYDDLYDDDKDVLNRFDINDSDLEDEFDKDDDIDDYQKDFVRGFKDGFEEAYEDEYDDLEDEHDEIEVSTSEEAGTNDGEYFAEIDAKQTATIDYNNDEMSDWIENYPGKSTIKDRYNLGNDNKNYQDAFIDSYEENYELFYNETYRKLNFDRIDAKRSHGYEQGYNMGIIKGEADALINISSGKTSDWAVSYEKLISDSPLYMRYNLYRDTGEYKINFQNGFVVAYETSYQNMFHDINFNKEIKNVNYKRIDSLGGIVEYEEYNLNYLAGSKAENNEIPMYIEIAEGTIYTPEVYFGIVQNQDPIMYLDGKTLASKMYNIKINSESNEVKLQKPIKVAFNFYGGSNAGVYKYVYGQWMYLPTKFEEGLIYTEIPAVDYNGGSYAVFVDNKYTKINSAMLHWAYQDIKLFIKRGLIPNVADFNPDENITRKEFARLIYRNTYGIKEQFYYATREFIDKMEFKEYENEINFMVARNYMNGVDVNVFDPDGFITYAQVEMVMNRMLYDEYSWDDTAYYMLTNRFHKSNVNEYKSNYISKAEVIYMLNYILGNDILFNH